MCCSGLIKDKQQCHKVELLQSDSSSAHSLPIYGCLQCQYENKQWPKIYGNNTEIKKNEVYWCN
jgi:hypothetical protein